MTDGRPHGAHGCAAGRYLAALEAAGGVASGAVSVRTVADAAVACALETADLVLVGAEGVMENGGVVNKIGTCVVSALLLLLLLLLLLPGGEC